MDEPLRTSLASVYLRAIGGLDSPVQLATATGFIAEVATGHHALVTNRHVVRGRYQESHPSRPNQVLDHGGLVPHTLIAEFNTPDLLGHWSTVEIRLGNPEEIQNSYGEEGECWNWLEHPEFGGEVDVVAIPLSRAFSCLSIPHRVPPWPPPPALWPTSELSVVGYPFGQRGSGDLAVWTRASVATEPYLGYRDLPAFLVDARTRQGQSGSPVVYYRNPEDNSLLLGGGISVATGHHMWLVGVYSGRIRDDSDLGIVWRSSVITEILGAV